MFAEKVAEGGSLPLSQHRIVSTARIDEAADTIGRCQVPVRIAKVADPGRFRLDMNGRHLGRIFIGFNKFATDTVIDPGRVEDAVVITQGCDHRRQTYFDIDDERVQASVNTAVVISPTRQVRIWRPSHSGVSVVGFSSSVLADRYEEITGASVQVPIVFAPSVDLTKGYGRLLREHTHALSTELDREGRGSESSLLWSILEDALISVVLALPGHHSSGLQEELHADHAPWVVRKAEEYMAAHVADPITMSDLVTVCGRSRSALFETFKSNREHTPMQFLAGRRLELARERLMREPRATTTEVALDCGFSNHGRFAKAYRSRFGETPSATHARCHGPIRS